MEIHTLLMEKLYRFKKAVFAFYALLILIFVVIKFNGTINEVIYRIQDAQFDRTLGIWYMNLAPFSTILNQWDNGDARNLCANVVLFMPLGVLLPWAFRKIKSFKQVFLWSLLFILSCELFQLFLMLGSFDVDDIILNVIGASMGYMAYKSYRRLKK